MKIDENRNMAPHSQNMYIHIDSGQVFGLYLTFVYHNLADVENNNRTQLNITIVSLPTLRSLNEVFRVCARFLLKGRRSIWTPTILCIYH